ncbi:MAG TPA: hypothetical protein VI818_08835 [Candidatus Thermoplasmatota archaeon]|nr:hypothetical protein [Candidatus Thermoplasmatota archaeon]
MVHGWRAEAVPFFALALLFMAGCTGPAANDLESAVPPIVLDAEVPCQAPYTATATTKNFHRLNHTGLQPGGPQEIDIRGDLLLAARAGGFTLFNISQPEAPLELAHYGDAGGMLDVKFTPDNATALVTTTRHIDVVDIRQPDNPVRVSRWAFTDVATPPSGMSGQNAHMVFTATIKGKDWAFLAPQSSTGVWILEIVGPPETRTLKFVGTTLPVQGGLSGPHDIYVTRDRELGWLLYTADAFVGWTVFDVNDPTQPRFVGGQPNTDVSGTHTVQAAWINGKRIVATSTEFGMNALKVWDATRLAAPVLIGYWTRSMGPEQLAIMHNFQIVDGRIYMAYYSEGIFVFNITKLRFGESPFALAPEAHFASSGGTPAFGSGGGGFWDVVLHHGRLYAGSYSGHEVGLHVIRFGCIPAGDARFTSTG